LKHKEISASWEFRIISSSLKHLEISGASNGQWLRSLRIAIVEFEVLFLRPEIHHDMLEDLLEIDAEGKSELLAIERDF
jgi:hypothetical protein